MTGSKSTSRMVTAYPPSLLARREGGKWVTSAGGRGGDGCKEGECGCCVGGVVSDLVQYFCCCKMLHITEKELDSRNFQHFIKNSGDKTQQPLE
ncbi:hypothetical protein E2C01_065344 [Portunus trituberculatus]|uniref:Uncharacterized protein n=1 Tax=Portunus trituberculatus TaxID=210409 RepID=A0A5B7HN47_PORTR|nr:hypothetical protein [Portunus trituberculatus]